MREGMLWFDNDTERSLSDKIERAAAHFEKKHGERPELCFVNPIMLLSETPVLSGIEIRATSSVLPNHFWLGFDNRSLPTPVYA